MSKKKKKLTKSNDKVISGVLGGVAEYFDWDKTITRLVAAVLCIFPGHIFGGILAYLIASVVMPRNQINSWKNQINRWNNVV